MSLLRACSHKEWLHTRRLKTKMVSGLSLVKLLKTNRVILIKNEQIEVGKIEKMSKSKKNVVNPSSIIDMYGADTARWFMLSDSPPERDLEWTDVGVASSYKFINKIWDTCVKAKKYKNDIRSSKIIVFNKLITSISENIEKFHFNKSVANIYEYVNELNKLMDQKNISEEETKKALDNLCIVLQPFTPHLSEEIWEMLGNEGFCANTDWPELTNDRLMKIMSFQYRLMVS